MFAEGTRVATKLLIIDIPRPPAPLHLLRLATMLPLAPVVPLVYASVQSAPIYQPGHYFTLAAYRQLFTDPAFWAAARNTAEFAAMRPGQAKRVREQLGRILAGGAVDASL